ncbi:uncharacterized protein LOC127712820 [Mytilus californianus]|uniref:uncharacterized protein LOC127712820 n=1 Tax=Mytilus californianus TaxID=6549 RepID=UPI002246F2A0|nr:uncharacterized protein LOC127712820 [Mytilus californianus]
MSFISAFFKTESAELAYMKQMMKYIDSRFDQMDKRFDKDLGTSVLRYTDSDRAKTQLFLRGVMQLLLQAIKIYQFATELFNLLSGKYYWRDWIVVSYNPIYGHSNHMMRVTGGHTLFRKHGRNLLVTSVDKNQTVMNISRAKQKLRTKVSVKVWDKRFAVYESRKAKDIFFHVDHSGASIGASLVSVITCRASGVAFRGHNKRIIIDRRCPYDWIIMWG